MGASKKKKQQIAVRRW